MKKPSRRLKTPPWSLARVWKEDCSAVCVWQALEAMANGKQVVTPTRDRLSKATGIKRLPTISKALTTLERAGWILREHFPRFDPSGKRLCTLLKVIMLYRERKTLLIDHTPIANTIRSSSSEHLPFQDSLRERDVQPTSETPRQLSSDQINLLIQKPSSSPIIKSQP